MPSLSFLLISFQGFTKQASSSSRDNKIRIFADPLAPAQDRLRPEALGRYVLQHPTDPRSDDSDSDQT